MLWRHDPTPGAGKQASRVGESGQALLQSVPRPPFWHRQTRHPTTQRRQAASVLNQGFAISREPLVQDTRSLLSVACLSPKFVAKIRRTLGTGHWSTIVSGGL